MKFTYNPSLTDNTLLNDDEKKSFIQEAINTSEIQCLIPDFSDNINDLGYIYLDFLDHQFLPEVYDQNGGIVNSITDIGDDLVQVDYAANGIRAHENDAPESHNVNIKGYLVENMQGKKYLLATEVSSKQIENNSRLIELLDKPWKLIKEGGKLGVKGVKHFFSIFLLFGLSNLILFIYSLIRLFSSDIPLTVGSFLYVLVVLLLGITMTAYASYRAYQYVIMDTIRVIYGGLEDTLKKIASYVVDKAEILMKNNKISDKNLAKALDLSIYVNTTYMRLPSFLRKRLIFILKKVPYIGMLVDLRENIIEGNKDDASLELYKRTNSFVYDNIFKSNNFNWAWVLYPINIVFALTIILRHI